MPISVDPMSWSKKRHGLLLLAILALASTVIILALSPLSLSSSVDDSIGMLNALLTDSASKPYFLISVALLCVIPFCCRLSHRQRVELWLCFALLLALSFVAKSTIKHLTAEPRPYTYELQSLHLIPSPQAYYALPETQKQQVINAAQGLVSDWRLVHWRDATNYALPSGHTIFVAISVLFWGGFLLLRRHYVATTLIIGWATGVAVSRFWLGDHSLNDILSSMVCAALLYLLVPLPQAYFNRHSLIVDIKKAR